MQIIRGKAELHAALAELRVEGGTVALVPTMGALHAGHLALVDEARRRVEHVVVSIFVNPTQFGATEDLGRYPRREASDAQLLGEAGVAILWAPEVATMYPDGPVATVKAGEAAQGLDGDTRPGHFDGVVTIVQRLFEQVKPDIAVFGEKDYQQLLVIRQLAATLSPPVEIIGVPTQRDADGLALSSRNIYLADEERRAARALPRALGEAAQAMIDGGDVAAAINRARDRLTTAGFDRIDYVALRDSATFAPLDRLDRPARLLAAAVIGTTRLIDNLAVTPEG